MNQNLMKILFTAEEKPRSSSCSTPNSDFTESNATPIRSRKTQKRKVRSEQFSRVTTRS